MDANWVTDIIGQYGYLAIGLSLIVNCLGIPIASEVTLPFSGVMIHSGRLDFMVTFVVAVVAQMIGFSIAYLLARYGGLEVLEHYGRYVGIKRAYLLRLKELFHRHGAGLVLLGSALPGLHGYVGFPAGLAGMPLWQFIPVALIGTLAWTAVLMGAGYLLGDKLAAISSLSGWAGVAVVVALLIAARIWYSKHQTRQAARLGRRH